VTQEDVERCEDSPEVNSWFSAVNANNVSSVESMIQQHTDVNAVEVHGILYFSCSRGLITFGSKFIQMTKNLISCKTVKLWNCVLHSCRNIFYRAELHILVFEWTLWMSFFSSSLKVAVNDYNKMKLHPRGMVCGAIWRVLMEIADGSW